MTLDRFNFPPAIHRGKRHKWARINVRATEQFVRDVKVKAATDDTQVSDVVRKLLALWLAGEIKLQDRDP